MYIEKHIPAISATLLRKLMFGLGTMNICRVNNCQTPCSQYHYLICDQQRCTFRSYRGLLNCPNQRSDQKTNGYCNSSHTCHQNNCNNICGDAAHWYCYFHRCRYRQCTEAASHHPYSSSCATTNAKFRVAGRHAELR